jgi:hypothetical protein
MIPYKIECWTFQRTNGAHTGMPHVQSSTALFVPPDYLFLDSAPNLGPLISRWESDKFKNF